MKLLVFSVYDKAVNAYLQPFFSRSKGEAVRSFTEACNDEKTQFSKHSMDFTLVYLGEWDDNSGLYDCSEPSRIIAAHEVIRDEPFTEANRAVDPTAVKRLPM